MLRLEPILESFKLCYKSRITLKMRRRNWNIVIFKVDQARYVMFLRTTILSLSDAGTVAMGKDADINVATVHFGQADPLRRIGSAPEMLHTHETGILHAVQRSFHGFALRL